MNDSGLDIPPIGENLKRERMEKHLSLGQLSKQSGISKAMLSQIESGRVNPTLVTIWKTAHALDIDVAVLIEGKRAGREFFCKSTPDQQAKIISNDGKVEFKILSAPGVSDALEMYHLKLKPGAKHSSEPHADGCQEFVLLQSGKVRITNGTNRTELSAGDFLAYRGDLPHCIENIGRTDADLHMTDLIPDALKKR